MTVGRDREMNDEAKNVRFSLKIGNSYQRVNNSGNKEVALIKAMTRDNGLPHVHYSLKVFTPSGVGVVSDNRVLSCKMFEKTFS